MRASRALVLGIIAVASLAPPSSATHEDPSDDNDTRGRLDVRSVRVSRDPPVWKVTTGLRWRAARIQDRGYFVVSFDTFGGQRADYHALLRSDGRRMRGNLWRDRKVRSDYATAWLRTWRKGRRSVKVKVPLRHMRMSATRPTYTWHVYALLTGRSCRRVCIDRVPDEGAIEEPNPRAL